mmetsp:Transcript_15586/g.37460  ORF Transcript_15586/g.37460 Transcript_15586/m.37460 type:complete len:239 (-) Transcript_15586:466-1182(-)
MKAAITASQLSSSGRVMNRSWTTVHCGERAALLQHKSDGSCKRQQGTHPDWRNGGTRDRRRSLVVHLESSCCSGVDGTVPSRSLNPPHIRRPNFTGCVHGGLERVPPLGAQVREVHCDEHLIRLRAIHDPPAVRRHPNVGKLRARRRRGLLQHLPEVPEQFRVPCALRDGPDGFRGVHERQVAEHVVALEGVVGGGCDPDDVIPELEQHGFELEHDLHWGGRHRQSWLGCGLDCEATH